MKHGGSNIAPSSGGAELDTVAEGTPKEIALVALCHELLGSLSSPEVCVDAYACKGMLRRAGAGRVRYRPTLLRDEKVPREGNRGADLFTHCVCELAFNEGLVQIHLIREKAVG